ncbi:MAG: trypsin-like peptidase domain-containing protein [Oscillospiraceae bacterium]|nr:trypsin-like peptidase domain-containing protein [Oscillospiraceae bacterium]
MYDPYNDNNNSYEPTRDTSNEYTPYPAPAPRKTDRGIGSGKLVAVAVTCSLLGGLVGAGAMSLLGGGSTVSNTTEGERPSSVLNVNHIDTSKELTLAELYAKNVNSTVGITTAVTTNYWGFQTTQPASGSGFIFSDDGYILTNHHVISGASSVTVTMYDGSTYDAVIVGYDASNDIAVLKIDATGLTPVVLGDSDTINVGDTVVAIGNPLGELTFSLTSGVVSALDREVTFSNGTRMDLIQTDCAINSGNSGGALFNTYGEVVGITNAKFSSSGSGASIDNIGFAIPMNSIRDIVASIIEEGIVAKPYIGVSVASVSEEVKSYGLPAGASVQAVESDSPAEKAGLLRNDIITEANGTDITTSSELVDIVGDCAPGDTLTLKVFRNGESITVEVTIGEKVTSAFEETEQQNTQQSQGSIFPWGSYR